MLGIRNYRGIAVDLWLGPWQSFVCDAGVFAGPGQEEVLFDARTRGLRHLAFYTAVGDAELNTAARAEAAMSPLRGALDSLPNSATIKRITFILNDKQQYFHYQAALFQLFPES
jgi:hypothetical protein